MFNIDAVENPITHTIDIDGWKEKLGIKYGLFKISEQTYLLWNVLGTNHTFSIPIYIVHEHHEGNYNDHFIKTLQKFREDLLCWVKDDLPESWMKKYYYEFWNLIDV